MTNINWKDEELKRMLANGDQAVYKVIFDAKYAELCYFANKIINNMPEAEDIVMDAFTRFWQQKNHIPSIKDLAAFLYTSVKNASLDHIRKQQRKPKIFEDLDNSLYSLDEILEGEEIYAMVLNQVYQGIESLPDQCKKIFKMLYFEGKSTQEIAKILNLSVQSVRNQKTRAIQLLKIKVDATNLLSVALLQVLLDYFQSK
ncbi:RNA polymerase sigma-70 factor (ECF subfamily) [Pedobacter africanus]|uniref:RNA polymerase sigma-70 factor (ECF subfamily) n=1 Tax=Pedobacter africanus TaxID=151894 RepID=A0ACC6KVV4_9SPHI|nr:RNA polymerase sigma-70 factor (ECF subfamily) [Pedobacter africanus]